MKIAELQKRNGDRFWPGGWMKLLPTVFGDGESGVLEVNWSNLPEFVAVDVLSNAEILVSFCGDKESTSGNMTQRRMLTYPEYDAVASNMYGWRSDGGTTPNSSSVASGRDFLEGQNVDTTKTDEGPVGLFRLTNCMYEDGRALQHHWQHCSGAVNGDGHWTQVGAINVTDTNEPVGGMQFFKELLDPFTTAARIDTYWRPRL